MPINEPYSGAEPVEPAPLTGPYKDRSVGLVIFGGLTVGLGCLSGLLVPLMLFGQAMSAKVTHAHNAFATILPAIAIYGGLAVALVWLGIGSIMARRWARALLLIFSWSWLVMGLIDMVVLAVVMPKVLASLPATGTAGHPSMPAGVMEGVMVVMFLVYGVILIVLPAIWTFFYNSRHVKATCEARDAVTRWTDSCPLPVLGFCLWLLFTVLLLPVTTIAAHGVMPFFGMFLTGLPGALFCLAMTAVWAYAAWLLYHLDQRGWWLILVTLCMFSVSGILTFARHDVMEMYRLMGYPDAQIEQIQKTGLLAGNNMIWLMSISMVPFVGYLFFIKRYLRRNA